MEKTLKMTNVLAAGLLGKDAAIDALIKANFTEKELSVSIFDRLDSFESALELTGETQEEFNKRTQYDDDQEKAGKELSVLFKAIREGNEGGYYYPYFNNPNRSGSGFSCRDYDFGHGYSCFGSRHTADTAEKATFLGKKFTSTFQRFING